MADAGLDLVAEHVEHADRGALAASARRGRDRDHRGQSVDRRSPAPDGEVDVVHEVAGVGGQEVDGFGGVDAGAASDRDDGVERAVVATERHCHRHAFVGRLDAGPLEHHRGDATSADLFGDPRRCARSGDTGIGDEEHSRGAETAQVMTHLGARARAELQLRRTVGEDALRTIRHALGHLLLLAVL